MLLVTLLIVRWHKLRSKHRYLLCEGENQRVRRGGPELCERQQGGKGVCRSRGREFRRRSSFACGRRREGSVWGREKSRVEAEGRYKVGETEGYVEGKVGGGRNKVSEKWVGRE